MTLVSDKRAALRFVQRRGFVGDELPKGERLDAFGCPLGKALGCGVAGYGISRDQIALFSRGTPLLWVRAPAVRRFIQDFDRGKYPDLIDESALAPG